MGTPPSTKTVRVSQETHQRLNDLAERRKCSVDDVIQSLLAEDLVRVRVTPRQRERWQKAATESGVTLPVFVGHVTEAAVMYGTDRGTMHLLWNHVKEIRGMLRARASLPDK
jgi:predicted HicB family RNase H-like nuclease